MEFNLSELDQARFRIATAKVKLTEGDSVAEMIRRAKDLNVKLLIVRLSTQYITIAQELEKCSATISDTLVYFRKKKIDKYQIELPAGYFIRAVKIDEAEEVENLASESFRGYFGHYHADPRLSKSDCDAVYASWAKNSCIKGGDLADEVLVISKDNAIAAFATLKILNNSTFEGVLFGVATNHRGKGLHLALMQASQNWGWNNNKIQFLTSTQITNVTVQKNWCRVGMEPFNSFYTYHLWLDV